MYINLICKKTSSSEHKLGLSAITLTAESSLGKTQISLKHIDDDVCDIPHRSTVRPMYLDQRRNL